MLRFTLLLLALVAGHSVVAAPPVHAAAPPVHEETRTGGSAGTASVSTDVAVNAIPGDLYLVAVSSKPLRTVTAVTGLGLSWTRVDAQCSGRSQTGVEVWVGQGVSGASEVVTANLDAAPSNAAIAVSRYSGADGVAPLGGFVSANSLGVEGGCSGGLDGASYTFDLVTGAPDALVFGAAAMRNRNHAPGAGYGERAERTQGSGGSAASVAVFDRAVATPGSVTVDGSFSGGVDWAVIGVEIVAGSPAPPEPEITVAPLTPDFGTVLLGESATRSIEVRNDGALDLDVTATWLTGPDADAFTVESGGAPFVLAPGGTRQVVVRFDPIAVGPASATLAIASNDPDEPQVDAALSGSGTDTPPPPPPDEPTLEQVASGGSAGVATVSTSDPLAAAAGQLYLAAVGTKPYRAVSVVDGLGLSWFPVRAQCGARGQTGVDVFAAIGAPTGDAPVTATLAAAPLNATIGVARYSGVDVVTPLGALVSDNTGGSDGACSGGSDSATYALDLTTTAPGSVVFAATAMRHRVHTPGTDYGEQLEVVTGSGGNSSSVALQDQVVASAGPVVVDGSFTGNVDWAVVGLEILATQTSTPQPDIAVAPASHDFGNVGLAAPVIQSFVVSNQGSLDLNVSATSLTGPDAGVFAIDAGGDAFTLAPGASRNVDVSFTAPTAGPRSAVLRIESDDPDEDPLDVPLAGNGVLVEPDILASPSGHDFGDVVVGQRATVVIVVANDGVADLDVTATTLSGPGEFAIDDGGAPFTLASGQRRDVVLSFAPTTTGPVDAILEIASDDPDTPQLDIGLAGNGIDVPPPGDIELSEMQTGGATASLQVATSAPLAALPGDLYLAAVASKPRSDVVAVAGLGLAWFPIGDQCAGRDQTGVSVWGAIGAPVSADTVTATFSSAPANAVLTVSRYSGVDAAEPLGAVASANTNGSGAGCTGGTDSSAYALDLNTSEVVLARVRCGRDALPHAPARLRLD